MVAPGPEVLRRHVERRPDLDVPRVVEPGGHHADHRVALGVELDPTVHHLRVAAEVPLPETEADDGHAGTAGCTLAGRERAPEQGADAEHREEGGFGLDVGSRLGLAAAADVGPPVPGEERARLERLVLRLPIHVVRPGKGVTSGCRLRLEEPDQPVGFVEGQGAEQDRIDDGEDGGVGADAERERQHGDREESGGLAHRAEEVADVLERVAHTSLSGRARQTGPPGLPVGRGGRLQGWPISLRVVFDPADGATPSPAGASLPVGCLESVTMFSAPWPRFRLG